MKDFDRIARKITIVLFLSQSLSSAGFIAAFTVNALVGVDLTGQKAMAGVPGGLYVVGQACGAMVWGFSMERIGRRRSIALGQLIGVIGSAIAVAAVVDRSFSFFLFGLVLVGMARSAVDLGRFVAAEVHLPEKRGRAISNVVLGSTVGAIFGPLLVGPMGQVATWAGYPELSGAYIAGAAVLVVAAILIFGGLRPEPRDIGRELARIHPGSIPQQAPRSLSEIVRHPGVIVAMVTMAFAQMVMVIPMSITSVHMKDHQHALTAVSLVISAHTLGMYRLLRHLRQDDRPVGARPGDHPGLNGADPFLPDGSAFHQSPAADRCPLPPGAGLELCLCGRLHPARRPTFAQGKGQNPGIQRSPLEPVFGSQPDRERGGLCCGRLWDYGADSGGHGGGAAGFGDMVADAGAAGAIGPGLKNLRKPE